MSSPSRHFERREDPRDEVAFQSNVRSRAHIFSGSLSAVGRREKLQPRSQGPLSYSLESKREDPGNEVGETLG